jgi:hypothetical protein
MDATSGETAVRGFFDRLREWANARGLPFTPQRDAPGRVVVAVDGRRSLQMMGSRSEIDRAWDLSVRLWDGALPVRGWQDPPSTPPIYYTLAEDGGVVGCYELTDVENTEPFISLDDVFGKYTEWLVG